MRAKSFSFIPAAVSTTSIAALQTTAGAGSLTLAANSPGDTVLAPVVPAGYGMVGGLVGHKISATSSADLHTINVTLVGLSQEGLPQTETFTGPNNSTVKSTLYYSSITSASVSGAATTPGISLGVAADTTTQTICLDYYKPETTFGIEITGTATVGVQQSTGNPFAGPANLIYVSSPVSALVSASASTLGVYSGPCQACRLSVASYSGTPTLTLNVLERDTV